MEPAVKILITGGTVAIAVALLLGFDLGRRRQKQPAVEVHAWLTAHQVVLMQGFMLFGLSLAASMSRLSRGLESAAAWLIVGAATSSFLGQVANARQSVTDQFAQHSLGLRLNQLQSALLAPGVGILLYGVVRAL
jgi:hypothetical protein